MGGVAGVVTVDLQQFDFPAHGGQISLFGSVGLAQVADFVTAGVQLRGEPFLGQLCGGQALFEQFPAGHSRAQSALNLPAQPQQRQPSSGETQHNTGPVKSHSDSCRHPKRRRLTKPAH